MLGVFDSGRGGLGALCELRSLLPTADIAYLSDTKNLPYGEKSPETLIPLIERALNKLYSLGCTRILIACVTASSLHSRLSPTLRHVCFPIITPVAQEAARVSKGGRIGIVATARTVKEGVLYRRLIDDGSIHVEESVGTGLVELVEAGRTDENDAEALCAAYRALVPHLKSRVDTLLLGCTHYPSLSPLFRRLLPSDTVLVPSGEVGARAFVRTLSDEDCIGQGITLFF